jgi:hypothetical protein
MTSSILSLDASEVTADRIARVRASLKNLEAKSDETDARILSEAEQLIFDLTPQSDAMADFRAGSETYSAAQAAFSDYFVKNYPGPDTIIHDPSWHVPKIFAAVVASFRTAIMLKGSKP